MPSYKCESCDEAITPAESYYVNGSHYCESCYSDNYFCCETCRETFSNDSYMEDGLCELCFRRANGSELVNNASFMPTLQFSKLPWENTLYQGVELEIELPEDMYASEHAKRFRKFLDAEGLSKFLYFKEDGSLENGYEIVSHPTTPLAKDRIKWWKVLKYLRNSGAKGFQTDTAGLHIHVSRDAMDYMSIAKIKLFFWHAKNQIEKVAGRPEGSYYKYEKFTMKEYTNDTKAKTIHNVNDRYMAVNVNPSGSKKKTVEFRAFKSTLSWSRFIGCLQFTEAVVEFCKQAGAPSIEKDGWKEFKSFVRVKNRWNHLEKHFVKVGV